jgi:formate dehydrogenase major subunit
VRACREVQGNDVIGYALRGADAHIMFDMDDPMGESTCVGCGECVAACPTGALSDAGIDPGQQWAWQGQESDLEVEA